MPDRVKCINAPLPELSVCPRPFFGYGIAKPMAKFMNDYPSGGIENDYSMGKHSFRRSSIIMARLRWGNAQAVVF
jgi:hypothetical protein